MITISIFQLDCWDCQHDCYAEEKDKLLYPPNVSA